MEVIHVKIIVFWVQNFRGSVSGGMGIAKGYHTVPVNGRLGEILYVIHEHNLFKKRHSDRRFMPCILWVQGNVKNYT